jgi:Peptidase family M48
MYGLLFVLLGAIGLNAGWIATMAYGIGEHAVFDACLTDAGTLWPATDLAAAEATRRQLGACLRPVTLPWALIMLAGAVTAYALTVLLAVVGAGRTRRLVRAAGEATGPAVTEATACFAGLCREHGVADRHPRLHVLRPGARFTQPFTTGGRRPLVVVPAAVACAGAGVLEPVLRHELAHVRARDVLLAAGAWWSGWAGVLLSAGAAAPFLVPGRDTAAGYGTGLLVAVVLGGFLLVLRAHVLRLRELAADRVAVDHCGRPGAFVELLLAVPAEGHRPSRRLRSLMSVHPDPTVRVRALDTPRVTMDGGFLPSAVTALVLLIAVQPVYQVVLHWVGWAGPSNRPLFAIAGGLLAVLLMPAWTRRYAADPRASWWPPVSGVAVGGAAGFFLPGPGLPVSPGTLALSTHWITGPLLMLALAGTAVVLVALAHGVDPDRRRTVLTATVAGAGVAAVTVPAAVQWIVTWSGGLHPTFLRLAVLYDAGLADAEPVVVFATVAALAVVAARSAPCPRPAPRPALRLLAVVAVVAATTGSVLTVLRESPDGDRVADLPLLWHRWWVSALAGAVVLVVLVARSPAGRSTASRLAGALTAAAGVTLTAAVAQFAVRIAVTGWDPAFHPWLLGQYVIVPLRILLLLAVVAVPAALAATRLPGPVVPARLRTPLVAVATAQLCLAVMLGVGERVTGAVPDSQRIAAGAQQPVRR